jgi:hypothetical protein
MSARNSALFAKKLRITNSQELPQTEAESAPGSPGLAVSEAVGRNQGGKELCAARSLGTEVLPQQFQNTSSGDKNAPSIPAQ